MKQQNFEIGRYGEELARNYLNTKGFKIITSNFKTKFGEIDIIANDGINLIFIEVKLKIGEDFGLPEEMINKHKLNQVQNTAKSYIQNNLKTTRLYEGYRIDAVCIVLDENKEVKRINHYENITF